MVVLILERVPVRLRGELSRWMLEPRVGVFVGMMSALVRDKLWQKSCAACDLQRAKDPKKRGGAVMICRARTEQGFIVRTHGDPSREMIDMEGITLVRIPAKKLEPEPGKQRDPGD